jgi:glycosyltransferase involved in cell wall biosynthesis
MILFLNGFFNRKTKRIIAISDWIRRFVNEVEAVPLEKIETIYYGLKQFEKINYDKSVREEIGFSPQTMVIGIVARLVEQKGHSFLIEAFSHIYQADRNVRLLIVGDGELMPFLQQLVRKKDLDGVITFAGFRHDRAEVLTAIDIFVHPSLWEGFGLSILEAMAMGKPIIATNVSAIPELLEDGISGLLVPPKEQGELAGAIEKLLSDRSLRESLGQNAQKRWQHRFSEEKMVTDTADLYSRC